MAQAAAPNMLTQGPEQATRTDRISLRDQAQRLKAALELERATFLSHWQDLASYLVPRRIRLYPTDRNKGDRRNQNIIDSTGRYAARTLQSGLHAGLTSPARPWMKLTTPDPALAEQGAVKTWLHHVTQRMLAVFLQTNLYNALPIVYGDMGVFGTAAVAILEDAQDLFRCYAFPIGSYAIGMDRRGRVSTFSRDYELTVRQVVDEFGRVPGSRDIDWTVLSRTVRNLWDKGEYQSPVQISWVIAPNPDHDPAAIGPRGFPWSSLHYEKGGDAAQFLRESGFRNFPILAPRWDITADDSYGTDCPGMTALGDVKALQIMQKRKAQGIEKMLTPSLQAPSNLRTQKVSLIPGDTTYVDLREGQQGIRPIHEVRFDVGPVTMDIRETQYRIQRAFFEDLFLMLAQSDGSRGTQPITAREVEERHEEKLLTLGPVLERTNDELLDPLVDRAWDLMTRAGLLPPPPDLLHGVQLRVEYTSILAQAQKLVAVVGLDRFMQSAAGLVATYPEVRYKVKTFQVIDDYADALGINPEIVIPDDEAQQGVDAFNKNQQEALQAAQAKQLAGAAKNLGTTPINKDTALDHVLTGMGGGAP